MGRKKKSFEDLEDLIAYCESSKTRTIEVFIKTSNIYDGIVESLSLYTANSGKSIEIIHDFESYGLDPSGDLGEQSRYTFKSFNELEEFLKTKLGIQIADIKIRVPLPKDIPSPDDIDKLDDYKNGYNKLLDDFRKGITKLK